ncbi:MAG: ribosomal protein L11 methyltransferase [Bradymonadia bacterium]|jgi:ribosomal protein L11 methyltransferase
MSAKSPETKTASTANTSTANTTGGWWQLSAVVPAELAETIAFLVAEDLNLAAEIQDAGTLLSADDAKDARVVIHSAVPPTPPLMVALKRALNTMGQGDAPIDTREQIEADWRDGWRAFFVPLVLSERFGVHPPWADPPAVPLPICINPGMAFGTGSHATTRGVIRAMDALLGDRAPARVLDVGTGSAILAIAAAKLGHQVIGVEIDETALQNAAENVDRNGVDVTLVHGSADATADEFEVVIANIIAPILISIAPHVIARTRNDLLLSGILEWQVDDVLAAYAPLTLIERTEDQEWVVLHLRA